MGVLRLKPKPAQADGASHIGRLYTALTSGPTLLWVCLAGAFQLIVVSTVWAWMPSFFNRYHGLSAALVVLCSAVGALLWGAVAYRVGRPHPQRKLYLMALLTTLTCLVFSCAFSVAHAPAMQYRLILLGSLLMSCTVGVTTSTVLDVTRAGLRSTGSAVLALFQNLFGLAIGPFVGGLMSDAWGLSSALAVIPWVGVLSALCFVKTARTYPRDMQGVADRSEVGQAPEAGGMPVAASAV